MPYGAIYLSLEFWLCLPPEVQLLFTACAPIINRCMVALQVKALTAIRKTLAIRQGGPLDGSLAAVGGNTRDAMAA